MHIAAVNPKYIDEGSVPAEFLEKEKEILIAQAESSGKPAEIIEKMIQGRLKKYLAEITLLGITFLTSAFLAGHSLVRSGLDDTMRLAYREIRSVIDNNDKVTDMRTAAYVTAINKIARSYLDVGVY